jgi:hypothetical protein
MSYAQKFPQCALLLAMATARDPRGHPSIVTNEPPGTSWKTQP